MTNQQNYLNEIKVSFLAILNHTANTNTAKINTFNFKNHKYILVVRSNGTGYFKLAEVGLPKHHVICHRDNNGQFVDISYSYE